MSETIYSIPITESFGMRSGCPICRLRSNLEEASLHYVMGPAMMEPDVRQETNRLGFCQKHLSRMLSMKNKLSLALILESHVKHVETLLDSQSTSKRIFGSKKDISGIGTTLKDTAESCYICNRVAEAEKRYISNTLYLWKKDESFRKVFSEQEFICLHHSGDLLSLAESELDAKKLSVFQATMTGMTKDYLEKLRNDLTGFAESFDHRNIGKKLSESERSAVENAIYYLSSI